MSAVTLKHRLHDTTGCTTGCFDNRLCRVNKHPTGCQTGLTTGCVWQPVECLYTRYNRLSIRLSNGFDNRFDNRVERTATVLSAGCQTGCTTALTTGCIHDTAVCQAGCRTSFTTGWMFVYTIQPVVKWVWRPVWQQVVSCKRGFTAQI